jgi:hypothetical protein
VLSFVHVRITCSRFTVFADSFPSCLLPLRPFRSNSCHVPRMRGLYVGLVAAGLYFTRFVCVESWATWASFWILLLVCPIVITHHHNSGCTSPLKTQSGNSNSPATENVALGHRRKLPLLNLALHSSQVTFPNLVPYVERRMFTSGDCGDCGEQEPDTLSAQSLAHGRDRIQALPL